MSCLRSSLPHAAFCFALACCTVPYDAPPDDPPSITQASGIGGLVANGSFESGTSPWVLNLSGGATGAFTRDCATSAEALSDRWSYRIDTTAVGADGAWDVTLRSSGLAFATGQTISISFDAMSPVARTIEAGTQQLTSPWTWYSLRELSAPGDSAWHHYAWSYTQSVADSAAGFNIDLGQVTGTVRIDNVVIQANGGANLAVNGSFETGAGAWSLLLNGGASATATLDCSTSSTAATSGRWSGKITTSRLGSDGAWDVQLRQAGLALSAGATVSVSFKALAKTARSVEAGLQGLASPYPWYSLRTFDVPGDGAWHSYDWTFTQPASDANVAFQYDVGQLTGDVWIDAVVVTTSGSGGTPPPPPPSGDFMAAPAGWSYDQLAFETRFGYSGMGSAPSAPNLGTFVAQGAPQPNTSVGFLNDWNFGNQQQPGAVWSRSGSSPYWGSSQAGQTGTYASGLSADYSFPGNVFQTSTGPSAQLFTGYAPQTFSASGTGLTLQDHYIGGPQHVAIQSNGSVYYYKWSSGMINTEGKRFFPSGGATEFYGQVKAKMAGPNSGSWSAIWLLPDQGQGGTGQEIDIQEYNVSGADPAKMYAHVQGPAVAIGTGTSSTPLSDGYHVYAWDVNSATHTIAVYLDGVRVGTYTGPQVGSRYYLILDAAISSGNASWQQQEGFVPDSTADSAMSVAEVQVYQR